MQSSKRGRKFQLSTFKFNKSLTTCDKQIQDPIRGTCVCVHKLLVDIPAKIWLSKWFISIIMEGVWVGCEEVSSSQFMIVGGTIPSYNQCDD